MLTPAITMDTPATLLKHPASSPLTAEVHQPLTSGASLRLSFDNALRLDMLSSQTLDQYMEFLINNGADINIQDNDGVAKYMTLQVWL